MPAANPPGRNVPPAPKPVDAADRWSEMRRGMPVCRRFAYFDHAAVAPLPEVTCIAMRSYLEEAADGGDVHWTKWTRRVEAIRETAARGLGASPTEIAFAANTTTGIHWVAEGFPWRAGDNVVLPANEFPSNAFPWQNLARRDVEARRVPEPADGSLADALLQAADERTRLIAVSWVAFASGRRVDVDGLVERAQRRGIRVFLDAIQGLGVFPLNVRHTPVDFLAADGHKWMLGPEGAGLFYCRHEHLDLLRPLGVGWGSAENVWDYSPVEMRLSPDARRYEGGTLNMGGVLGLGASLEWLENLGWGPDQSAIGERVLQVTDDLCTRLRAIGAEIHSDRRPGRGSGIVSLSLAGVDPRTVRRKCLEQDVVLNSRGGRIRLSPHAYTHADDAERLLSALESCR